MESVAVRSTVAAILYFFWLLFTDRAAVRVRLQDLWYFVGTGIFSVLFFNWCYFNAISLSALSVAAVLLYTSPVFVRLLSALCFQEPITPRKIGALLLTFCGCVLVGRPVSRRGGEHLCRRGAFRRVPASAMPCTAFSVNWP